MEDTHGEKQYLIKNGNIEVLILIIMEDTHGVAPYHVEHDSYY